MGEGGRGTGASLYGLAWGGAIPAAPGLPARPRARHHGAMEPEEPLAVLVRGKLDTMKEVQALLRRRGIESVVRRPDGRDCGSG